MRSFENEVGPARAAREKAREQSYVDQFDSSDPANDVHLSLEPTVDERQRLAAARLRTEGRLDDLKISKHVLDQTTSEGVKSEAELRALGRDTTPAREHFSTPELSSQIESDAEASRRVALSGISEQTKLQERMKLLRANYAERQLNIMTLEGQMVNQKDDALRAAQAKVLAQFKREQFVISAEIADLSRTI